MRIGVPKEIKNHEHRVAVTPDGVAQLSATGHRVIVEAAAGIDSGFSDADYQQAGAEIVADAARAWSAELVVKVKEPQVCEYQYLREDLGLFTFLHLAAFPQLAAVLLEKKVCGIAYETVQNGAGYLPLLKPMSEVAGRMAVQLGVHFLQKENGTVFPGKGCLPASIGTVDAMHVVILGAGNVGLNAADAAAGLGARVSLLERDEKRIRGLQQQTHKNISLFHFSHEHFFDLLDHCDLLIGAALIPGKHAPALLSRNDLKRMWNGSVFIDVSIDQGGISDTSRVTGYDEPVYVEEGVIHCCLPNLPAAVPQTSTRALTEVTLPYVRLLADSGINEALKTDTALACGLNVQAGRIVHPAVSASLKGKLA